MAAPSPDVPPELGALVRSFVAKLCLKASTAAQCAPLLAENLPLGLTLCKAQRTARQLRWFLHGDGECGETEGNTEALCALLVSETALVHYTPRPKNAGARSLAEQGDVDEKYWKRRYNYFARFDEGVRMDPGAWFEVTPESVARHLADRLCHEVVVDGTCGVGGNAIQFAMNCRQVIAVDTDAQRLSDARHNAGIYGVASRIRFVHDDFAHFAETYEGQVDAVFLSPPWGGPGHLDCPHFSLRDVEVPDIVRLFAAACKLSRRVVLYLPRHTDLHEVGILAQQHGFPAVEVEKVFFQHPTPHLKLVVVYFSPEVLQLGIPRSVTQKTVGRPSASVSPPAKVLAGARDLLSPALAGILLRAVYCRHHYLGRYVVRLALEMESEGQRKAPPSLRRRGRPRRAS
ncbi:unnamed protein product [Effrenium voratum]|uniref:Trimethylguanosine synthase n=1 Tax=Effrenium voratum TaxID=2562239 RepID=A0AA36I670_9DINO|nr:unnamed protein product [Effrenium voratum]